MMCDMSVPRAMNLDSGHPWNQAVEVVDEEEDDDLLLWRW